ncbi:MAG: hypothetical protein R3C02_21405 [Planctomycetaceae bacterium]
MMLLLVASRGRLVVAEELLIPPTVDEFSLNIEEGSEDSISTSPEKKSASSELLQSAPKDSSSLKPPWSKGSFTITPYGSLWANMVYATQRTNPGEFTFWVFSEEDQPEDAFAMDARRTRLGADITGPRLDLFGGADTAAKIEIDFLGEFVTENRPNARLRHGYWEAHNEDYRLVIGQTWDVISPLHPGTLNFSVGWNGGNIGFRRAQFRLERFVPLDEDWELTLQGSANQDVVADFPTDPSIRRESANWPVMEGRAAVSYSPCPKDPPLLAVGVSGHVGKVGFDFNQVGPPPLSLPPTDNVRIPTWSVNLDARLETENWIVQGEFFHGANLSSFLGGIGQGVCPCLRVPIHSTGGWLETVFHWTPDWESHLGAGIDDPDNNDSLLGRTYNRFIFGNLIWKATEHLQTGFELTFWKTLYHDTRVGLINPALLTPDAPGRAVTGEWMVRYDF